MILSLAYTFNSFFHLCPLFLKAALCIVVRLWRQTHLIWGEHQLQTFSNFAHECIVRSCGFRQIVLVQGFDLIHGISIAHSCAPASARQNDRLRGTQSFMEVECTLPDCLYFARWCRLHPENLHKAVDKARLDP